MGSLFKPKTPAPTPVTRMPDAEDPAVKEAEERKRRAAMARGGRSATIMTSRDRGDGNPGTSTYRNSLLGQSG